MADAPGDRDIKFQRIAHDFLSAFKDALLKLLYIHGEGHGEGQKQSNKSSGIAKPIRRELPVEDVEQCVALVSINFFNFRVYNSTTQYS